MNHRGTEDTEKAKREEEYHGFFSAFSVSSVPLWFTSSLHHKALCVNARDGNTENDTSDNEKR
jgi:hypothetical protein